MGKERESLNNKKETGQWNNKKTQEKRKAKLEILKSTKKWNITNAWGKRKRKND